jgi:hypothetical protein
VPESLCHLVKNPAAILVKSHTCHIHVYELAPTATELEGWLETVWALADQVHRIRGKVDRLARA